MYNLVNLKLLMRNVPSLQGCFSAMLLIRPDLGTKMSSKPSKWLFDIAVAKVPSRRYRNTESRVPSTFLSMVTLNDIYDVHLRA